MPATSHLLVADLARVVFLGVGATLVMDLWLLALQRLGIPTLNFAFLGRWVGHGLRGRWRHEAIAKAPPLPHETALGWFTHYATGIAFAALLVAVAGADWLRQPTPGPAVLVGLATVAAPLFVMQPAMGAGIASSRTATPLKNNVRSIANHTVFGLGLYASAVLLAVTSR